MNLRGLCASLVSLPAAIAVLACSGSNDSSEGATSTKVADLTEMCAAAALSDCGQTAQECEDMWKPVEDDCKDVIDILLVCISPDPLFYCFSVPEGPIPVGLVDENDVAQSYCQEEWVDARECQAMVSQGQ